MIYIRASVSWHLMSVTSRKHTTMSYSSHSSPMQSPVSYNYLLLYQSSSPLLLLLPTVWPSAVLRGYCLLSYSSLFFLKQHHKILVNSSSTHTGHSPALHIDLSHTLSTGIPSKLLWCTPTKLFDLFLFFWLFCCYLQIANLASSKNRHIFL